MSEEAKKEMAPVLQDFKTYLENHYMDELLQELKGAMSLNQVEGFDVDCKDSEIVIDHDNTRLVRAEPWRVDRTNLIADCKIKIKFGLSKDGSIPRFIIRFVNFTVKVTLDHGITLHQGISDFTTFVLPERNLPKLSRHLVPVLTYEEMEILVQGMLCQYLGDDALTQRENSAEELAKAMGLRVKHERFFQDYHTAAVLFLKDGSACIETTNEETNEIERRNIAVPAKTILLNDNRTHIGDDNREIYHECCHYEWHSMFFELQELHASDLRLLQYQETEKASIPAEKDLNWVEKQASFAGIAAMFPRPVFKEMLKKQWKEVADQNENIGRKLAIMICRIASEKQKAKTIIKTRMLTMGIPAVKGALNYVDGKYIADFAFDTDSLGSGETFVISRSQFTEMYEKDKDFRDLINTHQFIYADGHVCCNQPQYVLKTSKGYRLTAWALAHVNSCCLRFTKTYHYSAQKYRIGELHSDQDYNESYLMIHSLNITGMPMDELMDRNLDYLDELPRRPSKALTKLIKDRMKTKRALAASSGLSEAKICRMCQDDDYEYSIQDVTRIVIGLQLPPPLSAIFLDMTKFTRAVMVRYFRYQCIIDCLFMEDIQDVVDTHKDLFDGE